jgi:hypothetical protein
MISLSREDSKDLGFFQYNSVLRRPRERLPVPTTEGYPGIFFEPSPDFEEGGILLLSVGGKLSSLGFILL